MSLEQIVDYYEELTGTLDRLHIQHSTELKMINELLGIISIAEELTPDPNEYDKDKLIDLCEHWKDVA